MPAAKETGRRATDAMLAASEQGRSRILLVDDDERNLLAMSEVLAPLAEIVCATSGREALRELLKQDFAVILLDVFMPDMDGYETAGLIRSRPQTSRIPIIFLSAVNKEVEHLMRGYAMGAVDYVFKPVDPVVLKSKAAVFVDLYDLRQKIAGQAVAEQQLREATLRAEHERLLYERELQQAQLRQAAIVEALPIILYLEQLDANPRVPKFVSGSFEDLTGFTFETVNRTPGMWADRLHPDDRERVLSGIQNRRHGGSMSIEYRWQCADGNYKHFLDQAVMLRDADGRPIEFAGTLLDVTDQRSLQEQLVQARKMDALGQLTGGVAHDFNNLLAAVLGGLDLFERRMELPEREAQIVTHMRHAAERGVELVRRLMTFARKQTLTPVTIDAGELVDTLQGLVEHTFGSEIEVSWHVAAPDLRIFADRSQLELALMNLLINARDAMSNGGRIEVSIECDGAEIKSDCPVAISVRDGGSGIPAEIVEKVTEPFFTTKPAGKGTGLGLSMVAGFVHQSGGELRIDSEAGVGTTIRIVLPGAPAANAAPEGTPERRRASALSVRHLLLVDDEVGVREVMGEQIKELGIEVTSACDAAEALAHLEAGGEFDFVLTDLSMPGLDGAQLLDRIRQSWPQLPGAIMTGNPKKLEKYEGQLSAIKVIEKPLRLRDLEAMLARPG